MPTSVSADDKQDDLSKDVFVIMPFVKANDRDQSALTEFFETNIKQRIEGDQTLHFKYRVSRSGNEFNMLDNIVTQLRQSDLVLADLSGTGSPNPNVMYELAIRFSTSNRPVILFREDHPSNSHVFDVGHIHCFPYKVSHLRRLEEYIIDRIKAYEISPSDYKSPVLQVLGSEFDATDEARRWEVILTLESARASLSTVRRRMAGALYDFITNQVPSLEEEIADDVDQFNDWFFSAVDTECVAELNWKDFEFTFVSLPALSSLFVNGRFQNFIPHAIRKDVNTRLLLFYVDNYGIRTSLSKIKNAIDAWNAFASLNQAIALLSGVTAFIVEDKHDRKLSIYDALTAIIREWEIH